MKSVILILCFLFCVIVTSAGTFADDTSPPDAIEFSVPSDIASPIAILKADAGNFLGLGKPGALFIDKKYHASPELEVGFIIPTVTDRKVDFESMQISIQQLESTTGVKPFYRPNRLRGYCPRDYVSSTGAGFYKR